MKLKTIVAASTKEKGFSGGTSTVEAAKRVGTLVGERAKQAGIESVVLDRGGFKYHGRVAGVTDGAREAGIQV